VLETHPMHLFRIIQDVDSYSQFLPLCSHSKVLRVYDNGRMFDATLTVGMPSWGKALQEDYTSRVQVRPEVMTIETTSIESKLFDSLKSTWKLGEIRERGPSGMSMPSCDVDFEVEMTVSDPMIAQVLDRILEEVAVRQVEAFQQRCQAIPLPADLHSASGASGHDRQ